MNWHDSKPEPKVAAGGVAGAVGILVVWIVEAVSGQQVDAQAALILVGSVTAIAAYLMPTEPPWKK